MYDPFEYDACLQASIDKLEAFKQSLSDDDIRISIIDKELYEGYYDVFVKPEHRILTSYLFADYKVVPTDTVYYHEPVPALPFDCEADISCTDHITFKTELPQPLIELNSSYLSFLENHFNRDQYVLDKMLDSYNVKYQGNIVFYRFYEHIPYENILGMIKQFSDHIFDL